MKTYAPKSTDITHDWYIVDAEGVTLGRLATVVARYLIGKHKTKFAPYLDMGDNLIVINAEKIRVTGKKLTEKVYYRYSGYPGGLKEITLAEQLEKDARRVIEHAVRGMLPKNRLSADRMARLKVFTGSEHPHTAQTPTKLEIK